jgi:tetratricopeptide (TPR) repeat protein
MKATGQESGGKRSPGEGKARPNFPRRRVALLVLGLVIMVGLTWIGLHRWRGETIPEPPSVSLTSLDPAIAEQIAHTVAVVRAAPHSGATWGRLGLVFQAYDFRAEARFCFAEAEQLDPREPRWPYYHGELLLPEATEAAIAKLKRAAELGAPDVARVHLAEALVEQGQWDAAEAHFKQLLSAQADHAAAWLGLAKLNYARGRLQEGADCLDRCQADVHTAKSAYALRATIQERLGDAPAAETSTGIARSLPPDQKWPDPYALEAMPYRLGRQAWLDHAQQLLRQGRFDEATPLIVRVVKEYPEATEGWLLLGRLRLLQRNLAAAEQALREHLRRAGDSIDGQMQLGLVLLYQQRNEEAAAYFQTVIALKPGSVEAHYNLGLAQTRLSQPDQAVQSFQEALRLKPDAAEPYLALADLLNRAGKREEALAQLRHGLEMNPTDPRLKQRLQQAQRP